MTQSAFLIAQSACLRIPDSSVGIPDSSVGIPDNSVGIPDSSVGIPDSSVGIPDGSVGFPDGSVGISRHACSRAGQRRKWADGRPSGWGGWPGLAGPIQGGGFITRGLDEQMARLFERINKWGNKEATLNK